MIKEEPDDDIEMEGHELAQTKPFPKKHQHCIVNGCIYQVNRPDCTLFPLPDETSRRLLWLKRLKREDLNEMKIRFFVCEVHFRNVDFTLESNCKMLNRDAIPSLFLPCIRFQDKSTQVKPIMYDNFTQTVGETVADAYNQGGFRGVSPELQDGKRRCIEEKKEQFRRSCDYFLSDQLAELVKCQTVKTRHLLPHRIFSVNLFFSSPTVYQMLEKDFCLPTRPSLNSVHVPVSTVFCEELLRVLKLKVSNMSESEKVCAVLVDTMKLKANLFHNVKKDRIFGFHDIGGIQIPTPAMYAVVVLVRGIYEDWMQPVAFSFVSEVEEPSQEISQWIDSVLRKLIVSGLKIKAYVPSFTSNLMDEANIRQISVNKPYFLLDDTKIYYIFSVPEMMRQLRDSFLVNKFRFQKGNTSVEAISKFVIELYEKDKSKTLRMVPKLTDDHLRRCVVDKKKSTRLATQVFSNTVATALETYIDFNVITPKARATGQMLLLMNNLFDILNSAKYADEPYKTAYSGSDAQEEILKSALDFFQSLKVCSTKSGASASLRPVFIEGFQVTIVAITKLFKELKLEGYDSLFAGRLNLNLADNFFETMRSNTCDKTVVPTCHLFIKCFRDAYLSHILKPVKGGNSCSKDLTRLLIGLNEPSEKNEDPNESSIRASNSFVDNSWIVLTIAHFNEISHSEKNSVQEVGKLLLKKCNLKHKNCDILQNFSLLFNRGDVNLMPSVKCFVEYILEMEKEYRKAFETLQQNPNIAVPVYERIKLLYFSPPCPCFPFRYFQQIFIKLRIHMTLQYNNAIYRKNKYSGSSFTVPRITT